MLVILFAAWFIALGYARAAPDRDGAWSAPPEASAAELEGTFRDLALLESAYVDAAPRQRNDGLTVAEVAQVGGDARQLVALAEEIASGAHGAIDSLLVARNGKLVFESYFRRGRVDFPHPQASATKAHLSLAIGRAIQLGHLRMADLQRPLIDLLEGVDRTTHAKGVELITLHHALSMRSGIRIGDDRMEALQKEADQAVGVAMAQIYFENTAAITPAQQTFKYQGADTELVMLVLEAVVPGTAEAFIGEAFFALLGIENYRWERLANGLPTSGYGSSLTSRDMIKLGALVINQGFFEGEALIGADFIARSTERLLDYDDADFFGGGRDVVNTGYGYYWWLADLNVGDRSYASYSAQGGGGQFIIVIPELDLIIVVTGHGRENATMQMTAERILPAFGL